VFRRRLKEILSTEPRAVSSLARELGVGRRDLEEDVRHLLRSAEAQGDDVEIVPARCRTCGFEFGPEKLLKPGKCPACRGTRIIEAMIRIRSVTP
jgi:transcriptional regulator